MATPSSARHDLPVVTRPAHPTLPTVVVVVTDPVTRAGLAALLGDGRVLEVIGTGGSLGDVDTGDDAPQVLLIDAQAVDTPLRSALRSRWGTATVRALVRTPVRSPTALEELVAGDGAGFVGFRTGPEELRQAVLAVAAGRYHLDADLAAVLDTLSARRSKGPFGLTERELRVLELVPGGLTNHEIGARLSLGQETVKTHLYNARRKLGARDRSQAAVIAVHEGLAPLPVPTRGSPMPRE